MSKMPAQLLVRIDVDLDAARVLDEWAKDEVRELLTGFRGALEELAMECAEDRVTWGHASEDYEITFKRADLERYLRERNA